MSRTESFLPDEIVLDIISRLPAKDALQCRHVCRRWKDLTLTRDFVDLHSRRGGTVPLILVENKNSRHNILQLFLLDKWMEPACTRSIVHKIPISLTDYSVALSHNGLIVLTKSFYGNYIILNPINGENIKLCLPRQVLSDIRGVFFHPSMKEYCTLWHIIPLGILFKKEPSQYRLLNLGSNPCWRNIKNPVGYNGDMRGRTRPIFVDMYLYWIITSVQDIDIMEFDINMEELTLIHPPFKGKIYHKDLFNIAGLLSMVDIHPSAQLLSIDIWTLSNRSEQLWTKSSFCINNNMYQPAPPERIEPIAVVDGELVFFSNQRVFVCNLRMGTIRKFGKRFNANANVFSHVMTLASLRDCKSQFCMGKEGEEEWNTQLFPLTRHPKRYSKRLLRESPDGREESSTSNSKASKTVAQGSMANIQKRTPV